MYFEMMAYFVFFCALSLLINMKNVSGKSAERFYKLQNAAQLMGYAVNISSRVPEECTLR